MGIFESNIQRIVNDNFFSQMSKEEKEIKNRDKEYFLNKGIPNRKNEKWRHINLRSIIEKKGEYVLPNYISDFDISGINSNRFFNLLDCYKIFFVNGIFRDDLSSKPPKGLVFKNIDKQTYKVIEDEDIVENDELILLNSASYKRGLYLELEEGVVLDKPISLVYIGQDYVGNTISSSRVHIKVNKNAHLKLFEEHINLSQQNVLNNNVVKINLCDNALMDYYKYQNAQPNEIIIDNTLADINNNCNLNLYTISFNGEFIRNNLRMYIRGGDSSVDLNGLAVLEDDQIVDNNVFVNHKHPNCYSNQLYKGIYGGRSMGVFNGAIFVDQIAQKTNAFQKNKNIIFSDKAEVYTKPQLEIFADDVKCSHGCTVGKIEDDSLFYCRSRGIDINKSKKIIVNAFLSDVVDKIGVDIIRDNINLQVEEKIDKIVFSK